MSVAAPFSQRQLSHRDELAAKLLEADQQAANLAEAIANGGNIPALVARLQDTDRARQALATQLHALPAEPMPTAWIGAL